MSSLLQIKSLTSKKMAKQLLAVSAIAAITSLSVVIIVSARMGTTVNKTNGLAHVQNDFLEKNPVQERALAVSSSAKLPVLAVALTRFGFEPSQRTAPVGQCLLAVSNRSGLNEIDLESSHKSGEKLITDKYRRGRRHWEKLVTLTPGDYQLKVVGHPEWVLKVVVKPPGQ